MNDKIFISFEDYEHFYFPDLPPEALPRSRKPLAVIMAEQSLERNITRLIKESGQDPDYPAGPG